MVVVMFRLSADFTFGVLFCLGPSFWLQTGGYNVAHGQDTLLIPGVHAVAVLCCKGGGDRQR